MTYKMLEVSPGSYVIMRQSGTTGTPTYYSFADNGQYWWPAESSFINDCFTDNKELATKLYNLLSGSSYSDKIDVIAKMNRPAKEHTPKTAKVIDHKVEAFMKRATSKFKIPKFKVNWK